MKKILLRKVLLTMGALVVFATGKMIWQANAFPPAPPHVIHGMVRDEFGDPLSLFPAQILLEATNGVTISCELTTSSVVGENYRLNIPMDSITAPDPYKATALRATIPFRLKVKIGQVTYVPMEMTGNYISLGKPASDTIINLTLGVDSDGDGLPDSWEYALIQMLGGGLTLANINPNGDNDGDGISNYDEYIAGTYAFDPDDGLKLSLVRRGQTNPVVQFFGISGRNYTILGTTNLVNWDPVSVRVPSGDTNAVPAQSYLSTASKIVEAEIISTPVDPRKMFYRVRVN